MPTNSKLWQRIEAFDIDRRGDENSFSLQLARANGWSSPKARAAIKEYKRFVYLVCVADSPLAPSEIVDRVWRLHLADTRSSWADFCEGVLGRPIDTEPTEGDAARTYHLLDRYAATRALYVEEFAPEPPAEFWPPVSERFAAAPSRQEFVRNSGWIAPAPSGYGSILWCVGAALLTVTASCENLAAAVQPATVSSDSLGPMLLVAAVVPLARLVVRGLRRTPHDMRSRRSAGAHGRDYSSGYWGCSG